jgi:transcriptional regulator with XRE-family HTH domain
LLGHGSAILPVQALQNEFASAFGIGVSTLRHWERGDRVPHGPALVLLNVVEKEPKAVLKALAGESVLTIIPADPEHCAAF